MEKSKTNNLRRILLAVTETSSVPRLWREVAEHLADAKIELVTLFVSDDRWHRAASLPFTQEISRIGGGNVDFTPMRAEQIIRDVVDRTRCELQRLTDEADLQFVFEVLTERRAAQISDLVSIEQDVLIIPSILKSWPIYAELTRLNCPILLVDTEERNNEDQSSNPTTRKT